MHTYIHTYVHACSTYIHTYVHTYMHAVHTCMHTYIHTCMQYIHTCMHTCIHTCMQYIHTCIHAYRSMIFNFLIAFSVWHQYPKTKCRETYNEIKTDDEIVVQKVVKFEQQR